MVLVPPWAKHHVLLVAMCCAACGGDVKLRLGFALPEGESALTGTTRIELYAARDERRVAFVSSDYLQGESIELDGIDKDGPPLTLTFTARNAEGATVAYGELPPAATAAIADASETCCLTMCVCSIAYRASNACACGSSGCGCD